MRVLMELRPALSGFSGVPQETRLLFRHLHDPEAGVTVEGLLGADADVRAAPLPAEPGPGRVFAQAAFLCALVDGLQVAERPPAGLLGTALRAAGTVRRRLAQLVGRTVAPFPLPDAALFADLLWEKLFEKTLPPADRAAVVARAFRAMPLGWTSAHLRGLLPVGHATLAPGPWDVVLAQTPYPMRVPGPARLLVRYQDAAPVLLPHHIGARRVHQATHVAALRRNIADGAWFAVGNAATRADLLAIDPSVEPRMVVVPQMLAPLYRPVPADPRAVAALARRHLVHGPGGPPPGVERALARLEGEAPPPLLLSVATVEPRKNLHRAWTAIEPLATAPGAGAPLCVHVGGTGWENAREVAQLREGAARGWLLHLSGLPAEGLRTLYATAAAVVAPSVAEGFNYSGAEGMACGTPVLASDLAVHREVYGAAGLYFDPYDPAAIAAAVGRFLGDAGLRAGLAAAAPGIAARYAPAALAPLWREALARVAAGRDGAPAVSVARAHRPG